MSELKIRYVLELDEEEKEALKKILGCFNSREQADKGISNKQQGLIAEMFDFLPYREDE